MPELKEGTIAAVIVEKAKAKSQEEWERQVAPVWKQACQLLGQNPGFKGILVFWSKENNGDVIMMGLWDSLEKRMNYEDSSAKSVQGLFNPLFQKTPKRPRYVLTHSYTP